MRLVTPFALLLALSATAALAAEPQVGQLYECRSTDAAVVLTLVVGKVDHERGTTIVSVTAWNDAPDAVHREVGHLPFGAEALKLGCQPKAGSRALSHNFIEGYGMWREAFDANKGGFFTASPADTYQSLLANVPAPKQAEGADT